MPAPQTPARLDHRGAAGPRRLPHPHAQVLVAPAVSWTLGDQDALDTYLRLTSGPVELVLGSEDAVVTPQRSRRVAVHVLPGLVGDAPRARRADLGTFAGILEGSAWCTVLAPEPVPLDPSATSRTAGLAAVAGTAAAHGLDTRVLGFTWPAGPDRRAVRAARSAVRAGGVLHVNEDLDRIRAANDGVAGLRRAVDLRFCGTGPETPVVDVLRLGEQPFALVDVSALGDGADPAADLIGVIAHLQRRGVQVLLTPQDPRSDGDDRALCERAAEILGRQGVRVLDRPLPPAELRALAAGAQVVVTGRPSLAILALTCGTPVVGIAGDKGVAEVLRLVGTRDGCVQPRRGFVSAVRRLLDRILDDRPAATAAIRRSLPELVAAAAGSLDGLPLSSAPGALSDRLSA